MQNQQMRDSYSNRMHPIKEKSSNHNPSQSVTPYKNKSVPMNLQINTNKTQRDFSNSKYNNSHNKNNTQRANEERMNLSVDITSRKINP